jgi:hypothetical protein
MRSLLLLLWFKVRVSLLASPDVPSEGTDGTLKLEKEWPLPPSPRVLPRRRRRRLGNAPRPLFVAVVAMIAAEVSDGELPDVSDAKR